MDASRPVTDLLGERIEDFAFDEITADENGIYQDQVIRLLK